METFAKLVLRHRRLTVLLTLLLVLAGGGALAVLLPNVSERNEYPGLPSYAANKQIEQTYGTGGYERPFVPVLTVPEGTSVRDQGVAAQLRRAFDAVERETGSRTVSYPDTADERFVGADGRSTFGLVFGGPVEQGGIPGSALGEGTELDTAIEAAMRPELPPGATLRVTGLDALATAADAGGLNVGVKLLITIGAALAVLAWVFRSRLAVVPLLTALISLPVSFLGLLAASPFVPIHETTLAMVPLFGLGIAIDYALILVSRWREERGAGRTGEQAVHRAMATAGHAVLCAGGAVAVGLLALLVLPIPLLRSLGVGGTMVAAASALVSLTVLPLILARTGRRWDAARRPRRDRDVSASRAWSAWARVVTRHRWPALLASAGVLAALSVIAFGINLRVPESANLARGGPAHDGLVALHAAEVPSGVLTSFDVYVPAGVRADAVAATLAGLPGVHTVAAPTGPDWQRDGSALLTVLPVHEGGTAAGEATVGRVIDAVPDGARVGGNVTQQIDYVAATYAAFPWLLGLLALVTFVLLARMLRSLLLAVKAIVVNLLSLGAVLGAVVILWQWGWGTEALLGIQPDGAVGTFIPVTVLTFLFGLSMDYEVFLLAGMREEYDRTGSTTGAVIGGVRSTGRLVTAAALILFFSFASMATGGELDVAVFASAVALGILVDATLIRAVLVPAAVAVFGRWNWWLPGWAARVLRVSPGQSRHAAFSAENAVPVDNSMSGSR